MCLCKPLKQYEHSPAVQFQSLSLHHVNTLRVKQCSHHCQWVIVNDVDSAVDTQSNLSCEAQSWKRQTPRPQNNHSIITDST